MSLIETIRKALHDDPRPDAEIARAAGIHPVVLSRFNTSHRGLSADSLDKLASALGLKIVVKSKKKIRNRA